MKELFERLIAWAAKKSREYNARCWRTNEWY